LLSRTALRGGILIAGFAVAACEPTNQGFAPEQPIKYSHATHAGASQIDCQYCHFEAERGRYAGIPPAKICMNCHEKATVESPEIDKLKQALAENRPIEWVRVHALPDHVYFNHSAHVGAGVVCQECHGPIEGMGRVQQWAPLTMQWCLDCHREGSPAEGPQLLAAGVGRANRLTDCAVCHH